MLARPRSLPILATLLLLLLTLAHPPRAAASGVPAVLALRLTDVPGGLVQTLGQFTPNAQLARANHISVAELRRRGRVNGYEVGFQHLSQSHGICCIWNYINEYRSPRAAAQDYADQIRRETRRFRTYAGYREFGSRTGSMFGYTFNCTCYGNRQTADHIIAHKGDYEVSVQLYFVRGSANPNVMLGQAVHLARVVLKRIP